MADRNAGSETRFLLREARSLGITATDGSSRKASTRRFTLFALLVGFGGGLDEEGGNEGRGPLLLPPRRGISASKRRYARPICWEASLAIAVGQVKPRQRGQEGV